MLVHIYIHQLTNRYLRRKGVMYFTLLDFILRDIFFYNSRSVWCSQFLVLKCPCCIPVIIADCKCIMSCAEIKCINLIISNAIELVSNWPEMLLGPSRIVVFKSASAKSLQNLKFFKILPYIQRLVRICPAQNFEIFVRILSRIVWDTHMITNFVYIEPFK